MRILLFMVAAFVTPQMASAAGITIEAIGTPDPYIVQLFPQNTLSARIWYRGEFPITGAEFRLAGIPGGWVVGATANPAANIVIGSPVDGVGVNIAFPTCNDQSGGGPLDHIAVWLFDIVIFATTDEIEVQIYADARNPPFNPDYNCSLVARCGDDAFALECVGTFGLCINSGSGCGTSVSVKHSAWSGIKSLYR